MPLKKKTPSDRQYSQVLAATLLAAMVVGNAAHADTALTTGQTVIDTTGNPALGVISRAAGATALFNAAGIATATGTSLDNGILGPWAFIGTGTATRYATLDGSNNVVSYTAGTTVLWTGTINSATTNFDISSATGATYGGSERVANTIRYTGGAVTIGLGNNTAFGLTVNGLINAGTGTLTFQPGGGATAAAGIHIGATKELVLNAANAGITISSAVHENAGGASAVTVVGPNTVTLSGASDYTGITTVTGAGTLSVSTLANGGSNSSIGASTNVAGNLILTGGTLKYTGAAVSTDRLFSVQSSSTIDASGTGAVNFTNTGSMGFNGGTAAKTLTLTGTNTGTNTIAAVIGDNTGATSVTKSAAGTWVLSGANTYTGATAVNAGTLSVTGSLASGSAVSVASGATLRGTGTINGATTITSGGILAAGTSASSIGTLTFSSTLGTTGATVSLKLNSTLGTFDLLTSSGAVTLGSAALFLSDIGGSGSWTGTSSAFSILHGSSISGTFAGLSDGSTITVGSNSFTINYTTSDVTLTASAIPEPATYAAIFGALALGMGLIRRRCQSAV
ncbi:MAG: autotransporter-associated beta strand repeat-containing protein [Verrucomicrobia bacterium]|nr:autotransporter-associated beta strand repeat-containing protein [Verrucomicrobiota bacterium]